MGSVNRFPADQEVMAFVRKEANFFTIKFWLRPFPTLRFGGSVSAGSFQMNVTGLARSDGTIGITGSGASLEQVPICSRCLVAVGATAGWAVQCRSSGAAT